ncbi:MAG: T9SS type A sorting domain-containing protein [Chitinispirillaceae bacterium]|nr:T9SS type A sorting domain-containing protein [Chitinispirillaceae bacterium]
MILRISTKKYVMLFVALAAIRGYSQNSVTFNVDGAKTVINKEIFGVLMERLGRQWDGQGAIWVGTNSSIKNTNGMRQDVIDGFIECGIGSAEWPGGCAANGYNWSANKNPSNSVGVDRFIQFCKLTGAEAVICGKPTGNDAASNEAFCKYIMNDLDYPLKWFKVGNEVWGCGGDQNVNTYMPNYTANYNRLKELKNTENGKNLSIVAANDIEGKWQWLPTMLNSIGTTIDGVEYHDYIYYPENISSTNPTTANYWTIIGCAVNTDVRPHLDNNVFPPLDSYDPNKRIKLVLDEWGDWLIDLGDGWMQQNTVMDAVSTGLHLNMFVQRADRLGVVCLAQGVNVIHSVININTSGVMVKTPTFYVFKMFKPHHMNNAKFAPITASKFENANGSIAAINAAASVDDSGYVNVSLVNVDLSATRQVAVTLTSSKASYTVKSAEVVTGPAMNSCNDFGKAEQVNIQTFDASNYSIEGKTLTVKMPSKSVVMIRLLSPTAVQSGNLPKSGTEVFSVEAGSHGRVLVTSSVSRKAPVTFSLYRVDGRTLINKTVKSFESGASVFESNIGRGVYLIRITGAGINLSKKILVAK